LPNSYEQVTKVYIYVLP